MCLRTGVVLDQDKSGGWRATSGFRAFTAWNHDSTPGSADPAARAVQWLRMAHALHAPVAPELVSDKLAATAAAAVKET